MALKASELLTMAEEVEADLLRNGDPFAGTDWSAFQVARAYRALERDARRYRWLRSEGLEHINFENLTPDTCDVGLDYAVDLALKNTDPDIL